MTGDAIVFHDVCKSFGTQKVLRGLNLTIPRGKITVIIGRSGGGKSVILKHMIGLLRPDSGEVTVDGTNLSTLDSMKLREIRTKFGMLFQNAALFDSMNVFDNVAFPMVEHSDLDKNKLAKRVKELLSLVGLPDIGHKMPSELSGGMRKRVGLARAIALKPEIMLYDEPTTGLDPIMTDAIDNLILSMQKELGITSVVISHDIAATFHVADKIAMLSEGEIILSGTPDVFKKTDVPFVRQFLEGRSTPSASGLNDIKDLR
ncbi:MAG: ABC transporter ATP-binding protein [Deltaproteobacteria bacterium CG11_big_fil_rev_8_21_14_0_20_47_16]|nr:MAG: ABC transporter ATP-binding protein [Deltaproteobacteria bacterium CG11_big_fil_rev_8_21_14_0_20_47_16]